MMDKHLEDVSLSGLFLVDAGKGADRFFQVPPPSTQHTARDATKGTPVMVPDLLSSRAVEETKTTPAAPLHHSRTPSRPVWRARFPVDG